MPIATGGISPPPKSVRRLGGDTFYTTETPRIGFLLTFDSPVAIRSVIANVYNSAREVAGPQDQAGDSQRLTDSGASNAYEVFFIWDPSTLPADIYRIVVSYQLAGDTYSVTQVLEATVQLLTVTGRLHRYIDRVTLWLMESPASDSAAVISKRSIVTALKKAKEVLDSEDPLESSQTVNLTTAFDYALPADWQKGVSIIISVEYPVDDTIRPRNLLFPDDGIGVDENRGTWRFLWSQPSSGQQAVLTYTTPHLLDDGHDTIDDRYFEGITQYAAGYALQMLANAAPKQTKGQIGSQMVDGRGRATDWREVAKMMMDQGAAELGVQANSAEGEFVEWDYTPMHNRTSLTYPW